MKRLNKTEFYERMAPQDLEGLRKVLWNLYWRGGKAVHARIEEELEAPDPTRTRQKKAETLPDGEWLLHDVKDFVGLARSGAYMGGSREVGRKERSLWRVTFKRHIKDAEALLRAGGLEAARPVLEALLDLIMEMGTFDYFHSEDPVEAMKVVVSDVVEGLWRADLRQAGLAGWAGRSAQELIRWETRHGWTRFGWSATAEKERPLADVVAAILPGGDAWMEFIDAYLVALAEAHAQDGSMETRRLHGWMGGDAAKLARENRTERLALFNGMALERLLGSGEMETARRLVKHRALSGPEVRFLQALLARAEGDLDKARILVIQCLVDLPGVDEFIDFAVEIDATLPPLARERLKRRRRDG
ncbi:MAG: hypothetical protein ABIK09_11615 [Pseudomonadota bacterium]